MIFRDDAVPSDFRPGDRVGTHPASHAWISGRRFGDVVKVGRKWVHIESETARGVAVIKMHPRNLAKVKGLTE